MGSLGFVCLIGLYKLSDFMDVLDVLILSVYFRKRDKSTPKALEPLCQVQEATFVSDTKQALEKYGIASMSVFAVLTISAPSSLVKVITRCCACCSFTMTCGSGRKTPILGSLLCGSFVVL